jgi:heme-degrading monooxygenase HmoA
MPRVGQPYSSGHWTVKDGKEQEFIAAWLEFVGWAMESQGGVFEPPVLLQDADDPHRFQSFGAWADEKARAAWRSDPEFKPRIGKCVALCDDFKPHDMTAVATPG